MNSLWLAVLAQGTLLEMAVVEPAFVNRPVVFGDRALRPLLAIKVQISCCSDLSRQQEDRGLVRVEFGLVEDLPIAVIAKSGLDACLSDLEEVFERVGHRFTAEAVDGLHHQHIARHAVAALDAIYQPVEATILCA